MTGQIGPAVPGRSPRVASTPVRHGGGDGEPGDSASNAVQQYGGEWKMMHFGGHMSGWDWTGEMIRMALFWGLLIVLAAAAYRALTGLRGTQAGHRGTEPAPDSREILAERLARGEIGEDEYRSRLAALESAEKGRETARETATPRPR
jgi:putative membrane protein